MGTTPSPASARVRTSPMKSRPLVPKNGRALRSLCTLAPRPPRAGRKGSCTRASTGPDARDVVVIRQRAKVLVQRLAGLEKVAKKDVSPRVFMLCAPAFNLRFWD